MPAVGCIQPRRGCHIPTVRSLCRPEYLHGRDRRRVVVVVAIVVMIVAAILVQVGRPTPEYSHVHSPPTVKLLAFAAWR